MTQEFKVGDYIQVETIKLFGTIISIDGEQDVRFRVDHGRSLRENGFPWKEVSYWAKLTTITHAPVPTAEIAEYYDAITD
jgi:hypothetical protein